MVTGLAGALIIAGSAYWISRPGASMVGPSGPGTVMASPGAAPPRETAPLPNADRVQATTSSGQLIGVIRADGLMVPLAARQPASDAWTAMSGHAFDGTETIRIRSRTSLPAGSWTFHPVGDAAQRPMSILGEVTVPAHCEQQEVLTTDALAAGLPEQRGPPAGIATHGTVMMQRVEDVAGQPDDESKRAVRLIMETTHALEADLAARPSPQLSAILPEERRRVPVVIDQLHRVRIDRQESYYFEVHKPYARVRVYAQGWIVSTPYGTSLTRVSAGVYSGGEHTGASGQPLAALGHGPIWIMEMQYYEGSSYDLVDLSRPGQVISVPTGGC
jgi:hypothetical protein